jgi:glycosyltransferase involved in cell wall biosynthesis
MRVLILNWRDIKHPFAGGAEISLFEHAKYWQKKGAKIIWISAHFSGAKKKEEIDGIKIVRYGSVYTVHMWAFFENLKGKFKDTDIIVDSFHFIPYFSFFYPRNKTKILGLINEVAGKVWFYNISPPLSLFGYIVEPWIIKAYRNNVFITGSTSTKTELKHLGIPQKNIHVISHGFSAISVHKTVTKKKYPVIVFLGRVSKDKGISDAIEVFKNVRKSNTKTKFWIIGKEEYTGILDTLLEKEADDIKKDMRYFGYVTEKEKFTLLKESWVLIHPSYKEGWGLNVIEANSVGTPAVGYNVAGLQDSIQDKKTGLLTHNNTPEELANLVAHLLRNRTLYKKLSNNAIMWSKKFTWQKAGQASWKVLQSL